MFGGNKFQLLGIEQSLSDSCKKIGWNDPTEIQDKVIPYMLKGNDVIALAETGSGKTGAFALPILQRLFKKPKYNFALILTPTHELAIQIKNEFLKLSEEDGLQVITLVGGEFLEDQMKLLKANKYHIVIGTPGRICKHIINTKLLSFKNLQFLILDEADRMLSDDFMSEMESIMSAIPKNHQTCLFSATMTNKLEKLETVCLKNPYRVEVSRKNQTVEKLRQEYVLLAEKQKIAFLVCKLQSICSNTEGSELSSAIVFTNTKKNSKLLFRILSHFNISVVMLQSDMDRGDRQRAFDKFSEGKASVLVATDVASRGLDIPNVSLVINFEVPDTCKDYQHRVGRTARAGRAGLAITMTTLVQLSKLSMIWDELEIKMIKLEAPREMSEIQNEALSQFNETQKVIKEEEKLEIQRKKKDMKRKLSKINR